MSAAQNLQVQLLFTKSAEDEATIAFAIPDATFLFHVQQAIEKLLKALLSAHSAKYPHTHDLQLLVNQLASLGERLPDYGIPLAAFTPYGVTIRYDEGVALTEGERQQYRKIVEDLRTFVVARVDALP